MRRVLPSPALPLLCLALAGCGGDERAEPEAPAGAPAMEGLSPDEIRQQAEPMSPAVAESLGIVDTTIHVEQFPGDSAILNDSVPR